MAGKDLEIIKRLKPEPPTERELECMEKLDPVDFQIFAHKMEQVVEEGRRVMASMGMAQAFQGADCCCSIYTAQGDMATAAPGTYIHSVVQQIPMKFVLKHYKDDPSVGIKDGDIFYCNETLYGGIHNPDQLCFMPIFYHGDLVAWAAATAHEGEVGGTEPGGFCPSAKSRYDEGMHIAPIKLGEDFQLKKDLIVMLENSVRTPLMQTLDIKARVAGCERVRRRFLEVVEKKGVDFCIGGLRRIIEVGEKAAKAKLMSYNDGIFRQPMFIDSMGREASLLRVMVTLRKQGDHLTVDLTGTSPENDGPYNGFQQVVAGAVAVYLYGHIFKDLPVTSGVLEAFDFIVPDGSLLNANPDAAVNGGIITCSAVGSAFGIGASKMIFDSQDRLIAGAPYSIVVIPHYNIGSERVGHPMASALGTATLNGQGSGARPDMDGVDVAGFHYAPMSDCQEVEHMEVQGTTLEAVRNKFMADGHGPGKYRGGTGLGLCGIIYYSPVVPSVSMGYGSKFCVSLGIFGGYAGPPTCVLEVRNTGLGLNINENYGSLPADIRDFAIRRPIQGVYSFMSADRPVRILRQGDILVTVTGGAGGYGDVLERDPELVMQDIKKCITSHWAAQYVYHVAYDAKTLRVDYGRTQELRNAEREGRKKRAKRYHEFEAEWLKKRPKETILKYYGSWPSPTV